ncbi:M18 family aminopeptidase [Corynebacterium pyruviciproducens]|uniref:M18 family aminopeptidase n=1 Tax=Corynebacterium pyruviciproducens TaxID=598660 RepID=UPI0023F07B80|nr:M18 family aminopeptidase [Corynebacterium pyruviciproducens]MDK6567191.1 M18 family aminopeptidase [Corynebacterium pyruviciproducens]MDK7213524.1 M18 family aminopeptidase [Corynebacterium pyruviciproducens]
MSAFTDYLDASPSSFHAADEAKNHLVAAGFTELSATDPWDNSPGGHVMVVGGAVLAWWVPEKITVNPIRIVGAHTDSPGFKLKPQAEFTAHGFSQAGVEVYGGAILSSWFDRELVLAGTVTLASEETLLVTTPPALRIPHLAIHLDRSANQSFSPDKQDHLQPIVDVAPDPSLGADPMGVLELIATAADVRARDIVTYDLITCDAQPAALTGAAGNLIASGRLDNLSSVWPAITALERASKTNPDSIIMTCCFDHEEVGSSSRTGAGGPLLEQVIRRTLTAAGLSTDEIYQVINSSIMVSADAAHSIHPNYAQRHDPHTFPIMGSGPVVKYNANQRYATTSESAAAFIHACDQADVPVQEFVSNNDVPCGSTIGPIFSTRTGISTVDVGIPLLSMHSARELCHADDIDFLTEALRAFFEADRYE